MFRGLVALIFWAPLPLASNRTWSVALLVILSQCLMAIVALMIHSTVDFNLQLPANAMTLLLIMGMAWLALALPCGATVANGGKRA